MKRYLATLVLIVSVLGLALMWAGCGPPSGSRDVETALSYGRLAPIPTNATSFRITPDTDYFGAFFMRFTAPSNVIIQWIADSRGLTGVAPTVLGPGYEWVPFRGDASRERSRLDVPYVAGRRTTPEWWHPILTNSGALYRVPGKEGCGSGGPVVVDQCENTVYVYTRW